jgi:hypothetical protein
MPSDTDNDDYLPKLEKRSLQRGISKIAAPHATQTTCDNLPALPPVGTAIAQWDGIEGLALAAVAPSPVIKGQPALDLIATATLGRHRLGVALQQLAPNRTYRVTAWIKAPSDGWLILDVRDGTSPVGRVVPFDLARSSADEKPHSVNGWVQATTDVYCADGMLVVYAGLAEGENSHAYLADGRTRLTFGGVTVAPLEPSEILHAPIATTVEHFVVTRFGIGVHNESWYDAALGLFESVTCPSMRAQTSQEFTWLIVVDRHIPELALSRLRCIIGGPGNIHVVPLDLTNIDHVRHGCFDHVWRRCQDYIIECRLLTDPFHYVLTSTIDGDDAWHRDMVKLAHQHSAPEVARLAADESTRSAVLRHTCGQVLTFSRGLEWFAQPDDVRPIEQAFIGMSIFVLARFSSGISVLSSRHLGWPAMAHALMFEIKLAMPDHPMWIYVRHDRTQTDWKLDVAETDAACTAALHSDFGIDFAKVQAWRAKSASTRSDASPTPTLHRGLSSREQHDCYFRIAALNRQIAVLSKRQQQSGLDHDAELLLLRQREARLRLLQRLQQQADQLFQ